MKQFSRMLATVASAALIAGVAHAGGPTVVADDAPVAAAPEAIDWSGLRLGIAFSKPTGDNFWAERSLSAESSADDWSGTMPSVSVGYDWQHGNLVYGAVLSVHGGDMNANPTTGSIFGCTGCETSVDKLATLRGRLGWALGKTLVFASAGAARANALGSAGDGTVTTGEDKLSGWIAGLGVEHFISQKLTVSAEYLHTDLGRLELPTSCFVDCYTDIEFGMVQLGINYRW